MLDLYDGRIHEARIALGTGVSLVCQRVGDVSIGFSSMTAPRSSVCVTDAANAENANGGPAYPSLWVYCASHVRLEKRKIELVASPL